MSHPFFCELSFFYVHQEPSSLLMFYGHIKVFTK